jgi:putative ABC transport system permease protein
MNIQQIAWRNITRNRQRSLLAGAAMLLVCAVLVAGFGILEGIKTEMIYNVHSFSFGEIQIRNPEYERKQSLSPLHLNVPDADSVLRWVENQAETRSAVQRVNFGVSIQGTDDMRFPAEGWGIEAESEEQFCQFSRLLIEGRMPAPQAREAVMGRELARKIGLKVGDKFSFMTITANRSLNGVTLRLVGLVEFPVSGLTSLVFAVPLDTARSFLQMGDASLRIMAKTTGAAETGRVRDTWNRHLAPMGLEAASWQQSSFVYGAIQFADIIINIIGVMFILLGSAVIINTTMMVVFERRVEIGTLGAMGMNDQELLRLFLTESLFLSIIGSTIGVAIGIAVTGFLGVQGLDLSSFMNGIKVEFPVLLYPVIKPWTVLACFIMTVALSGLAALMPAWMATRIPPIEALRT